MDHLSLAWMSFILSLIFFISQCNGELGSATWTNSSLIYINNDCNIDVSQSPTDTRLALAGDSIWDNGAACNRKYNVRCTSAAAPGKCIPDTIKVMIVGQASKLASSSSREGTVMVLPESTFQEIAINSSSMDIDYQEF